MKSLFYGIVLAFCICAHLRAEDLTATICDETNSPIEGVNVSLRSSRIVPTGDYALNSLGLSTQVPANAVYLTDGSPRRISVGKGHGIMFKHTSELKALSFRSDLMMRIVAAMRGIGEGKITDEQKRILKEHIKNVAKEDYNEDIKLAPAWVRKELIAL